MDDAHTSGGTVAPRGPPARHAVLARTAEEAVLEGLLVGARV
jgi:hypothetical protein